MCEWCDLLPPAAHLSARTHTTTWPAVELTQTKAGNNQLKAYPTWLTCPSLAVVNIYSWTQWSTADCSCVCCVCVICSLDHTSSGHCALCVGKRKRVINQKRLSPSLSLSLSRSFSVWLYHSVSVKNSTPSIIVLFHNTSVTWTWTHVSWFNTNPWRLFSLSYCHL